jgi:hypothetical protein
VKSKTFQEDTCDDDFLDPSGTFSRTGGQGRLDISDRPGNTGHDPLHVRQGAKRQWFLTAEDSTKEMGLWQGFLRVILALLAAHAFALGVTAFASARREQCRLLLRLRICAPPTRNTRMAFHHEQGSSWGADCQV